eukprot:TRINITY_DN20078_c0_g1_i2.p1 TRINITY_DN20078_c0_g1~~TRINITY_DN20078_c0_g1_i2.p1  ORF type:complete len:251 (+),score=76.21 TRINITY_DN20078_c0_g1_i2:87-839(+)
MPRRLTLLISDDGWVTVRGEGEESSWQRRQAWQGLQGRNTWQGDWYTGARAKKETKEDSKLDEMRKRIDATEARLTEMSKDFMQYMGAQTTEMQQETKAELTLKELEEMFQVKMHALTDYGEKMSKQLRLLEEQLQERVSARRLDETVKQVEQMIVDALRPLNQQWHDVGTGDEKLLKATTEALTKDVKHLERELNDVYAKVIKLESCLGAGCEDEDDGRANVAKSAAAATIPRAATKAVARATSCWVPK